MTIYHPVLYFLFLSNDTSNSLSNLRSFYATGNFRFPAPSRFESQTSNKYKNILTNQDIFIYVPPIGL